MAIYEDSLAEVGTPFSPSDTSFSGEQVEAWWSPSGNGRGLLPILLALIAIAAFIIVRPEVGTSNQVQNNGIAVGTEVSTESGVAIEKVETDTGQLSDFNMDLSGSSSRLSPVFTQEVLFWEPQILRWAANYGIDPNIVATIMQIESCGNPGAESYVGAKGLFQVMPFHFAEGESMLDPDTNAMRGLVFFNEQLRYTNGDILLSFAGYNGGYAASGGNYANWPNETQRYYYWAKGIYEEASGGMEQSPTLSEWLAAGGAAGCQRAAAQLGL